MSESKTPNPVLSTNTMLFSRDPWARGNAVVMSHRTLANETPVYSIRTQRSAGYEMTLDDIVAHYEVGGVAEDIEAFLRETRTPIPAQKGVRIDIRMNGKANILGERKSKITLRDQSGAVIALSGVNMVSCGLDGSVTIGLQAHSFDWENGAAVDDAVSSVPNHGPCGVCGEDVVHTYPWIIRGKPMHADCFKSMDSSEPKNEPTDRSTLEASLLKVVRAANRVEVDGKIYYQSEDVAEDGTRYFENHLHGAIGDGAVVVRMKQGRARILDRATEEKPKHYVAVVGKSCAESDEMAAVVRKHLPKGAWLHSLVRHGNVPGTYRYSEVYVSRSIPLDDPWLIDGGVMGRALPGVKPQHIPEVAAYKDHEPLPWIDGIVPKNIDPKEVRVQICQQEEKDAILRDLIKLGSSPPELLDAERLLGLIRLAERARKVISI